MKMSEDKLFQPATVVQNVAHVQTMQQYDEMYKESVNDPSNFWTKIAKDFYFQSPPTGKFLDYNFDVSNGKVFVEWMKGAVTNVCYNVLDRHVENGKKDSVCFYWEGNEPDDSKEITYGELYKQVCKFANVLKDLKIKKGDHVAIYMPMIVELVVAMLACARIGAVHSIVFGGFSSDSLAERILDGKCCLLITADGVYRGKKMINLKDIADGALKLCNEQSFDVKNTVVVCHLGSMAPPSEKKSSSPAAKRPCTSLTTNFVEGRDFWYHDVMSTASEECKPEWLDAEDPLFMLYTSGSTGKPKGVLHTQAGYMMYAATTFKYVFDYHDGDIYWCTADIGWITGHSYITYGPMANGATSVLFEGVPTYPGPERCWQIVQKYKVSKFYTAPTLIRTLMKYGEEPIKRFDRSSLRVLGSVGEPINPEAWLFYHKVIGDEKCSIVDTFWQTETGGHTMTPLPGCTPTKPGAATFPFFGIVPVLMDENGKVIEGEGEGYLVFKQPWPGVMRTIYGNHPRYEQTYFTQFPGYYKTGDGAKRDKDGYMWITGRIDDMLNVSGHLLSTAAVESALVEHAEVAEAAVVSLPHKIKGETCYCFVTLIDGFEFTTKLVTDLKSLVRTKIGPFAQPEVIQNAPGLPKTRSGKIMRRVLRKIARNDHDFGDVSTMADSSVIEVLFANRPAES